MNVSLRNFRHFPSLSEETYAFRASILIDGKLAGSARNYGRGGPTELSISNPVRADLVAYAKSLPPVVTDILDEDGSPFVHQSESAEDVIDNLVHEQVLRKEQIRLERVFRKELSTKLLVLMPDNQILSSRSMEPTRLREVLQAEYVPSWAAGGVILNVLPEDEARSAWFKWAVK
jgi:hypothetical protein